MNGTAVQTAAGAVAPAAAVPPPVLAVERLAVTFRTRRGPVRAVEDVSFAIAQGRTMALVGESGSGKSVTSLAVMRLLAPEAEIAGAIRLLGADGAAMAVESLDERAMQAVRGSAAAMIFQEPMTSLNPVHRVGAQIAEAIRLHRPVSRAEALAEAERSLAAVGIPDPARRLAAYPHELSGGMRQRVMIAMALACRPRLLIADEPTTALDVTVQAQIMDLLAALKTHSGMAMLFITHDLGLVADVADAVAVMYAGQIVESGPVAAILGRPRHPYTRALLDSVPRLGQLRSERRLQPIPNAKVAAPRGACRFSPRCGHAAAGRCDAAMPALEADGAERAVRCLRWRVLDLAS